MNILGHSYVAVNSVLTGNRQHLIIGALLPECFPFVKGNPFTKDEIHEGGLKFLEFLKRHDLSYADIAFGMLSHSVEFGADKWNKQVEEYVKTGSRMLEKIANASGISLEIAQFRLHNFLWWGVDVWIMKEFPRLVKEVGQALGTANPNQIGELLSTAFDKDKQTSIQTVRFLLKEIYRPEDLLSVEGLARIWGRQAAGLPEKDWVEVEKASLVMLECAELLKNDWRSLLELVTNQVGENLTPFGNKEGNFLIRGKEV